MSTKTSIKRIALVAVSALGFGLLSVVPAKAAAMTVTCQDATENVTTQATGAVVVFCENATFTGETGSEDTFTIGAITGPVGATVTIDDIGGAAVKTASFSTTIGADGTATGGTITEGAVGDASDNDEINGTVSLPGTYTIVIGGFTVTLTATLDAEAANSKVTAMSLVAAAGNSFATGTAATWNVSATADTSYVDGDDSTFKFIVSSQPAATAQLSVDATAGATTADGSATSTNGCDLTQTDGVRAVIIMACNGDQGNAATMSALGTIKITPTVAGTYTITAWKDTNGDNAVSASEATVQTTATFSVAGALTQIANSLQTTVDRASTVALTSTFNSARVGTPVIFTPTVKLTADSAGGGISAGEWGVTLKYRLSGPTGHGAALDSSAQTLDSAAVSVSGGVDTEGSAQSATAIEFTPDIAGTYTVTAWHDGDNDGLIDNGEASGSLAVVVSADAIALTVKAYNSTALGGDYDADTRGALVQLTLTNGGVAASLNPAEKIRVSVDSGQIELESTSSASSTELSLTTLDLVRDDFDSKGRVWLNFSGAAATTQVITFDGIGGGVDTILKTQTITYKAGAGVYDSIAIASTMTTGVLENTALVLGGADGAYDTDVLKATSLKMTASFDAADAVGALHIKDTSGLLTGLANLEYSSTVTGASTAAGTVTVSLPSFGGEALAVAGSSNYQWSMGATLATNKGVVTLQSADDAAANSARDQNSVIRAKVGSAITVSLVVKDQFKVARANEAVAISIAGRNAHVTTLNGVTDASGRVSFTYTDAPLTGVTSTQDIITFNQNNGTDLTYTVNFVDSIGVSKVVAYGGNTSSLGVTSTTPSFNDIDADGGSVTYGEGAENGAKAIYAKVTDASGSVLVGVPVTFSVAGSGVEIATNKVTAYTDTSGIATSSIYGWLKGTYTYTATADGVSGTGTISFAQTAAGDERTITATVSGTLVTAKVVDRFGNPVPLVKVWATKTGAGYFGNGLAKTDGTTDSNGEVSFTVAGADADVTVATYDMSDATAKGSGQTCALAGNVDCSATAPTAFDAYVAGTTLKGSTGVGASFAPAGVASATVKVTGVQAATQAATDAATAAADAAAEAIDAANAATDAANLAAEAADAATVAAEEARDAADAATAAVEELATQVATLMAALKAQITTLANTVAKIAKKVRA